MCPVLYTRHRELHGYIHRLRVGFVGHIAPCVALVAVWERIGRWLWVWFNTKSYLIVQLKTRTRSPIVQAA